MVPLALNADNRAKKKKLDGPIAFFGPESSLPASASRAEFLEKTAAWNKEVGEILNERAGPAAKERVNKKYLPQSAKKPLQSRRFFCYTILAAWCGRLKWPL